ncbi:Endophilin-A1, partial [Xenoophorus captivus]
KVDTTSRAVLDIMTKTTEYLQPNPGIINKPAAATSQKHGLHTDNFCLFAASRAKLSMINTMSKIRGQEKGPGYPQAETILGDAMLKFGRDLGEESCFGEREELSFLSCLD